MSHAQETTNVEILHSEEAEMTYDAENHPLKKLITKVKLRHKGTLMFCDIAIIYYNNNVDAVGNIKIIRPNGTVVTGNTLNYYSDQKLAVIRENVKLVDKKSTLKTSEITYDMNNETAYYTNGGVVENDSTTITSNHGTYYTQTHQVFFRYNVKVVNPQYRLTSDTLEYNTETKINTFYAATTIENDSGYIWCNKGWYNENNQRSAFGKGTIIYNPPQTILTDSVYYDRKNGFARMYKTFEFHDTASKIHIYGDTADYFKQDKHIIAYRRPLLIYESGEKNENQPPLFVRADKMESEECVENEKILYGYGRARIYNRDFQGVCDTFVYFTADSLLAMHQKPIAWFQDKGVYSQLMGKDIFMKMKNKNPDKIYVNQDGLMIQQEAEKHFNQISSDTLNIYLKDKKIDRVQAINNAKSIYYAKDDPKGYLGLNNSVSTRLNAYFDSGKVSRIVFIDKPKATFYPTKDINETNSKLKNFQWHIALRPKNDEDL